MRLSVILVNFHSLDALLGGLAALATAAATIEHEVRVIDNSAGDGAEPAITDRHPTVHWSRNPANLGFARAVDRGIEESRGEFLLVMNPDCELRPDALVTLLAWMDAHPRCGIAGPRLEYPGGGLQYSARRYPGPSSLLFNRYSLLTRLFPRNPWSRRYLMTDWDHASPRDVDWLSGACMLARRTAVEQVGPLDPAFFMFNEDVDWCHRMNDAGWTVSYVPAAIAVHRVGASRRRVPARVIVERHRGMLHYLRKHHPLDPIRRALVRTLVMSRAGVMLLENAFRPR